MNPIQFECPQCGAVIEGDDALYGKRVECRTCHTTVLAPPAPVQPELRAARLIHTPDANAPTASDSSTTETEIFDLSPVARAFPGPILLGGALVGLGIVLATQVSGTSWPHWVPVVPLFPGAFLLLLVWARVKSSGYRLTTQRLFVRRGWLAKHVNELELYRVKDVVVDQGIGQRILGYGTITVLADDDTTPVVILAGVPGPVAVKEMIRTQYRAARQREGVRPTEFLQSP